MRIGIIGCGKIADDHVAAIAAVGGEVVAVCDREELMAKQLAERLPAARYFGEASDMLKVAKPEVVHVTTSPQSHFALGRLCIEAGCHVLMEKPFTVTCGETDELIAMAERRGVLLTAGHNHQFSHAATELRRFVSQGYLGGPPVHMESIFCYNMSDERYAKALLGDKRHWVRSLPGKLLQNVISHGVSKIAEYVRSPDPRVTARGFSSPLLVRIGETEIVDELRVIIEDENGATAYFTFSSQISPGLHQFRLHGPQNSLWADYTQQWVLPFRKGGYRSYLAQFLPPLIHGRQQIQNGLRNVWKFARNELHEDTGRRRLLSLFYRAVTEKGTPPIPYREIRLTARLMDEIFAQVPQGTARTAAPARSIQPATPCR